MVGKRQKRAKVKFTAYGDESDHGAYRVPLKALVEGGQRADGDRHVLAVDAARCKLYELYRAFARKRPKPHWNADSGVIWDLRSAALRTDGFTSADAAGLPIFPGLVRFDEAASGHIDHAIRVTVDSTQDAYLHPASHCAGDTASASAPPMGLRLRLGAGYDISGITGPAHTHRRRDEAVRPDRRRQRVQLVHLGHIRSPLVRREPGPAQVDPRFSLPGSAKRRTHSPLLRPSAGALTIRTPISANTRPMTAPTLSGCPRIGTPAIAVVAGTR